ncbi:aspartyl protease-domain-containing protein [Schizophyllum fasciatum]
MELTFVTELGQSFVVEIDPNMELENVMALLEAESGIPVAEQAISFDGRALENPKATMRQAGIPEQNAMLMLQRKVVGPTAGGAQIPQDAEMMRLQLLGDPALMQQLRDSQPDLANAAQNDPARFAELLRQTRERQYDAELNRQREIAHLNADPFDVEAQQKIEEAIRQQAVLENMEHALEYSPESFGRVMMLYIDTEVNGHPVKAFVDSGAQQTITVPSVTPECAEKCNIMRLIDRRFAGLAVGVGTAKILGRVHTAQLKVSDLHLPCAFTIMEGQDVDLLLGLDMLKGHRACIDLEKNVLRIQGREIPFLSEHELPEKARDSYQGRRREEAGSSAGPSSAAPAPSQFPGGGHTLGVQPRSTPVPAQRPQQQRPAQTTPSERDVQTLMDLGVTREVAISTLNAAATMPVVIRPKYADPREVAQSYRPQPGVMSPGLRRARAPYLVRNALVGTALACFIMGVYAYSLYAVRQDKFDDLDEEARELSAAGVLAQRTTLEDKQRSSPLASAAAAAALDQKPGLGAATPTSAAGAELAHAAAGRTADPAGLAEPRGVLAKYLADRYPTLFDPSRKTVVFGAPSVDNPGRISTR